MAKIGKIIISPQSKIENHNFTGRLLWHPLYSQIHDLDELHLKWRNLDLAAPPQIVATLHCGARWASSKRRARLKQPSRHDVTHSEKT